MFGEREVRKDVAEVRRHERRTAFFLPSRLSAIRPKNAEPEELKQNHST